jgi:hypothetical protein
VKKRPEVLRPEVTSPKNPRLQRVGEWWKGKEEHGVQLPGMTKEEEKGDVKLHNVDINPSFYNKATSAIQKAATTVSPKLAKSVQEQFRKPAAEEDIQVSAPSRFREAPILNPGLQHLGTTRRDLGARFETSSVFGTPIKQKARGKLHKCKRCGGYKLSRRSSRRSHRRTRTRRSHRRSSSHKRSSRRRTHKRSSRRRTHKRSSRRRTHKRSSRRRTRKTKTHGGRKTVKKDIPCD